MKTKANGGHFFRYEVVDNGHSFFIFRETRVINCPEIIGWMRTTAALDSSHVLSSCLSSAKEDEKIRGDKGLERDIKQVLRQDKGDLIPAKRTKTLSFLMSPMPETWLLNKIVNL